MDEPGARVVEGEGHGDVAVAGKGGGVAAGRVDGVEVGRVAAPQARVLREDPEVVAVQVHGVRDTEASVVLDDEDDVLGLGGAGSALCV